MTPELCLSFVVSGGQQDSVSPKTRKKVYNKRARCLSELIGRFRKKILSVQADIGLDALKGAGALR